MKGIVDGLRLKGRTVLVLNQWRGDKAGSTPGAPDLLVNCPFQSGLWWGIEVKTPHGPIRKEQRELVDAGLIFVVRSIEEAFAAVGEVLT